METILLAEHAIVSEERSIEVFSTFWRYLVPIAKGCIRQKRPSGPLDEGLCCKVSPRINMYR